MTQAKQYEVIIIGGSFSGLSAGVALGRALRHVLIVDGGNPCNRQTPFSHNFLTHEGKTPKELNLLGRKDLYKYKTVDFVEAEVIAAKETMSGFEIMLEDKSIYAAKKLIFATGIKDLMMPIPGFQECWGISVVHCPYCHGYELKNLKTGLLANGEEGFKFAALLSCWTKDLTLFTNEKSILTNDQRNMLETHNIYINELTINEIEHKDGKIQQLIFADGTNLPIEVMYTVIPFEQHCRLPLELGCDLTDRGYIKIDGAHRTTVPGVFACGDNSSRMRTVANAVAMGNTAGQMVNRELIKDIFW